MPRVGVTTRLAPVLLGICLAAALGPAAQAIETDQYYAWDREIADSTRMLNAKTNGEILSVLDEVNLKRSWKKIECHEVAKRIERHFRLLVFHDLELWADNTSLIERVPATPEEELHYREVHLLSNHGPFDIGTWMPPSPTIELAGVRIGTDKLTHFFSEGWMHYIWYRKGRQQGQSREDAEARAIRRGILLERSVLGTAASGVFAPADLEANYAGMEFFIGLCAEDSPALRKNEDGWRLARPLDFRDFVSPEWDESYQPSVYTKRRWGKVRPVLLEYCPLLDLPQVLARREAYAARDRFTVTERTIEDLVEQGKLEDPRRFSLERVCGETGDDAQRKAGSSSER